MMEIPSNTQKKQKKIKIKTKKNTKIKKYIEEKGVT